MERKDNSRGLITNIINFIQWWPGIVFHHIGILVFLSLGILYTSRVRGDGIVGFSLLMELSSIFVALRTGFLYLIYEIIKLSYFSSLHNIEYYLFFLSTQREGTKQNTSFKS